LHQQDFLKASLGQLPGVFITRESRLPSDEYTRESLLYGGEDTRELIRNKKQLLEYCKN
jgi:hypothetical protein